MKQDSELLQQIEAVKRDLGIHPKVRKLEKKLGPPHQQKRNHSNGKERRPKVRKLTRS